ncbi:MAG: CDP-diacylglycerol--glycerol-3-phosphate 3-phosphatidyltransferase [Woeseia sp.]|nr:CDP-diacylglycerol--glycerol-3-phosphate 3-phosphatidyltransferase [Woeseia sp.]|tara:strand:+ start:1347 stop:1922 length:576 start_codon:yes stop_codon:yes gene_type:complete
MNFNIPNILTWIRLIAIPIVVWCFFSDIRYEGGNFARPIAGLLFALAAFTDLLDGYLARKLGQTSKFGAFLDPVADKLLVAVCLVLLVQSDARIEVALIAAVIIGREITVSALREWMASLGARSLVKVGFAGKLKTLFQMGGIALMVYEQSIFGVDVYEIGYYLLLVAAVMTLYSMFVYMRAAWPEMSDHG